MANPLHYLRRADAVSRAIKVNQTGYLPTAKKVAYLGGFLHDLGPLVIPDNTPFTGVRLIPAAK